MSTHIYFDNNATTPVDSNVLEAMLPYYKDFFGNASSIHYHGRLVKKALEESREKVADLLNCTAEEIVFTSGGTEADNLAIFGIARSNKKKGNHIITSQIEHHAILNTCKMLEQEGFEITYLPVDKYGIVNLDDLQNAIKEKTVLITIMAANNEIGTIEPIEEISKIARSKGVMFHTDAVQAVGKIPIDLKKTPIDLLSLSAHKLYGPKGIGALFVRKGTNISAIQFGGHHEHSLRAGTENIPGIVGLGKASEIAKNKMEAEEKYLLILRENLYHGIMKSIPEVFLNGHINKRLSGTLSLCFKYIEGEAILLNLDSERVSASSGSACTSGSADPSHVLLATGVPPELAHGSIRFSLGRYNTQEEVDYLINVLPGIIEKLRNMSPLYCKK